MEKTLFDTVEKIKENRLDLSPYYKYVWIGIWITLFILIIIVTAVQKYRYNDLLNKSVWIANAYSWCDINIKNLYNKDTRYLDIKQTVLDLKRDYPYLQNK